MQVVSCGVPFLFVPLTARRAVDNVVVNTSVLDTLFSATGTSPSGVFVFSAEPGEPRATAYSRMFAPHTFQITEDPATGAASGPLGAFAVRYGIVPRSQVVSMVSEQGTKMKRQSFVHIELEYPPAGDLPSRIEVGGGVVPVLTAELTLT